MKFRTSITQIKDGREIVRGKDLNDWVKSGKTFAEAIFLLLRGKEPTENETKMMNALLSIAIDHGPGTASGMTSRIVASAKNSMHTSVAAGILAMGDRHGSAIEGAMKILYEQETRNKKQETNLREEIRQMKDQKIKIPGYGHSVLEHDYRADTLFEIAKKTGFFGKHCELALTVQEELNTISSKKLPLNVDGAMAAVLCDMGFDARLAKGLFIIARTPGLVAQVYEEMVNDEGLRGLAESDIEYV